MISNLNAVYENGAFHPVGNQDVGLKDGSMVSLTVEPVISESTVDVLALAAKVYEGLPPETVAEIEQIATDRSHFFSSTADDAQ